MWLFRQKHNTAGTMVSELQKQMSLLVVSVVKCILWCCLLSSQDRCKEWMRPQITISQQLDNFTSLAVVTT